jgi:hypothetical protein
VADRHWRRRIVAVAIVVGGVVGSSAFSPLAWADSKEDAATAYDRGAAAYDKGDFRTAANELARADELAQSAVTLELAITAAVRADEPELAMTLVERAEKRRGNKSLDTAAASAKKKLGPKVGKLNVVCPSSGRCVVSVDGTHFETGAPRWIAVGAHQVSIGRSTGGAPEKIDVTIESGKTVELVASNAPAASEPPPPTPPVVVEKKIEKTPTTPPSSSSSGGISSTWFWVSLGVTAAVGGATLISGLDTMSKHDAFLKDKSNPDAAEAGKAADTRTVILLVSTGVLAAVTVALGAFFVDWGGVDKKKSTGIQRGKQPLLRLTSTGLVF